MTRPIDYVLAVIVLLVWLIPITLVGLTSRPVVSHPSLAWIHNISCLFTGRHEVWPVHHVEVRPAGSEAWITLPFEGFAPMETFGYRSRLDRRLAYIYQYRNKRRFLPEVWKKARAQEKELAEWVARRWDELNPEGPPLAEVRMVRTSFWLARDFETIGGRWDKRAFETAPESRKRRFGRTVLQGEQR